jgi:hypothetical protein|tara:strand:+ start:180 stop:758 length:579 start_codon:yes stop_codon:yes gene_type:complete
MENLFNTANIPTLEPLELTVGDLWQWTRPDLFQAYGTGYSLSYKFLRDSGTDVITINASTGADTYTVSVASTTTVNYGAYDYVWQAYITRSSDSNRIMVDEGKLSLNNNLASDTGDQRSHAKKVLDAVESVIEGTASRKESSYSIAGRSLSLTPMASLLQLRAQYRALYKNEIYRERIKNGKPTGKVIKTRF